MPKTDDLQTKTSAPAPAPAAPKPNALPTPEQVAEARAKRKASATQVEFPIGTVLGLPPGWASAKMDLTIEDGRKASLRAKWTARGWIRLDELQNVIGYPLPAEVWVKPQADHDAACADRDRRIQELAASGQFILGNA